MDQKEVQKHVGRQARRREQLAQLRRDKAAAEVRREELYMLLSQANAAAEGALLLYAAMLPPGRGGAEVEAAVTEVERKLRTTAAKDRPERAERLAALHEQLTVERAQAAAWAAERDPATPRSPERAAWEQAAAAVAARRRETFAVSGEADRLKGAIERVAAGLCRPLECPFCRAAARPKTE